MSRLRYFSRETIISLRRNLMMTLAGIITVAISLFLFGGIRLVQTVVDHGTERWKNGVSFIVYMRPDASQAAVGSVRDALQSDKQVKSFTFVDHQGAYREAKRLFKDQPVLLEDMTPQQLPESFRVVPIRAEVSEQVAAAYKTRVGVQSVYSTPEIVKRLLTITHRISIGFDVMAIALLVSSVFLIVNTIRLATFARRREIEVMKLVGASNWFVRVPFMAEGFVQGVIGAALAVAGVWGLKMVIANFLSDRSSSPFRVDSADAMLIALLVLFIGALIGTIGSAIGLRRFLDV